MYKLKLLEKVVNSGVVAVVRGSDEQDALNIVKAAVEGGIKAIEVTMTIPNPVDVLKKVVEQYKDDQNVLVGAGTVIDAETCRACILAGAKFIVSPNCAPDVIKVANRYQVPMISGAMTITEAITGLECGADIIKVFPGNAFGPSIIKAFKGPLPQAEFMPTGGVDLENMHEWFKAGVIGVGIGSDITSKKKGNDYSGVKERAAQYIQKYKEIKE